MPIALRIGIHQGHVFEAGARIFGDDIKIKKNRSGGGKITIGFSSDEDIAYFLDKLEGR